MSKNDGDPRTTIWLAIIGLISALSVAIVTAVVGPVMVERSKYTPTPTPTGAIVVVTPNTPTNVPPSPPANTAMPTTVTIPTNAQSPTISSTETPVPATLTPTQITDGPHTIIMFADEVSLTVFVPGDVTISLKDLNLGYRIDGAEEKYFFLDSDGFAPFVNGAVPPPFCLHLEQANGGVPFPQECKSAQNPIVRVPGGGVFWWDKFQGGTKTLFVNLGDGQLGVCATGFSRCSIEIP